MNAGRHPDVVVVGGGIIGLATARELAGRGAAVTLLERGEPGRQASGAAAGLLAPLAEAPEAGPLFDAAREARDLWGAYAAELAAETGVAVEYDDSGSLVVAADAAEAAALDRLAAAARRLGEAAEGLPVAEARALVPDLAPAVDAVLLLPGDHRVDNVAACAALAAACRRRGVELVTGATVERVDSLDAGGGAAAVRVTARHDGAERTFDAGAAVVAAGAWSAGLGGLPPLPVRPLRGQMLALGGVAWPWRGALRAGERYAVGRGLANAVPRGGGRLLVGATVEEAGFENVATAGGLAELTAFVGRFLPALAARPLVSVWAGLRPATPDAQPILGRWPERPGVWAATGHHRNGILLAPWTARHLADRLAAGWRAARESPFSATRFAIAKSV